jgi:predicted enzyme related to lactoylglutathione lyase
MHTFAHVEIPVLNLKQASTFYGALFHWKFREFYGDDYLMVELPSGESIGGLSRVKAVPVIDGFYTFVEVEDVGSSLALAERLGGQVIRPRTELPEGFGAYGVFQSPDGYRMGVWAKS